MTVAADTILLAEDDPVDVMLMRRALAKAGLTERLEVVRDGDEALAYLCGDGPYSDRQQFPLPAIMLLDLKLPRRSGFEVLTWLRAQADIASLPVVILSSSNYAPQIEQAYRLGANSFLVKPPDFSDLVRLVSLVKQYWLGLNCAPEVSRRNGGRAPSS